MTTAREAIRRRNRQPPIARDRFGKVIAIHQDDKAPPGENNRRTKGGEPVEKVEDRPNVSTVTPEDYPAEERSQGVPEKAGSGPGMPGTMPHRFLADLC